jgi:hypothetical protein
MPPKPINKKRAYKLAIDALLTARKKFVFDSNLYRQGVITAETQSAERQRAELDSAIELLKLSDAFPVDDKSVYAIDANCPKCESYIVVVSFCVVCGEVVTPTQRTQSQDSANENAAP